MSSLKPFKNPFCLMALLAVMALHASAQLNTQSKAYTFKDTLRGTLLPERTWWDVRHYAIHVVEVLFLEDHRHPFCTKSRF